MQVVNLWGGPGTGKSTTRAGLFHLMKLAGLKVDEAPEYAKDLTYDGNLALLSNQWHVTGEQYRRVDRLRNHVDWVISDSPLPLGIIYAEGTVWDQPWYYEAVWASFSSFDNINVFLERVKPFQGYGRNQTEDEARNIDRKIRRLVGSQIDLYVAADAEAPQRIMDFLGVQPTALAA